MDEKILFERLDRIIVILQNTDRIITILQVLAKPQPLALRIVNGAATGVGLLGVLSAIELIRSWIGG